MTELVYSRDLAPQSPLIAELKALFSATPLAVFAAALKAQ